MFWVSLVSELAWDLGFDICCGFVMLKFSSGGLFCEVGMCVLCFPVLR